MASIAMELPKVVSREEWLVARKALLTKEKLLTRASDALSRERRQLPWVKVEKPYVFDGPNGPATLATLFDGRSQLIIDHFMMGPGWPEGCVGCSFTADHVDGARVHLENHDVSFVAVSRAPLSEIQAFQKRMGWRFQWVSSFGSDFNFDYHASFTAEELAAGKAEFNYAVQNISGEEMGGFSFFYKDAAGDIFHTYSCFARGGEKLLGAYMFLDMTPKGRNEDLAKGLTDWVRHHDKYCAPSSTCGCAGE